MQEQDKVAFGGRQVIGLACWSKDYRGLAGGVCQRMGL